jgi:hypothetical protein
VEVTLVALVLVEPLVGEVLVALVLVAEALVDTDKSVFYFKEFVKK